MNFWHMQLHEGAFRKTSIGDIRKILSYNLIGCSGEPVGSFNQIGVGDIILIRHGGNVVALVEATSQPRNVLPEEKDENIWFDRCVDVEVLHEYDNLVISGDGWFLPKTLMPVENAIAYNFINNLYNQIQMQKIVELLQYKKQIILQGPPGTGKTRMAKELASQMTGIGVNVEKEKFNKEKIKNLLDVGGIIKTRNGKDLKIISFEDKTIKVKTEDSQEWTPSYNKIISSYKGQLFKNVGRTGGFIPYEDAIAKYLYEKSPTLVFENENKQMKLIQFHPSYTYEDFVRGISVENKGTQIDYVTKNKVLAQIASDALENYLDSQKESKTISKENWVNTEFELFVEEVDAEILKDGEFKLNDKVSVFNVEEDAFRYYGANWEYKQRMKFKDIKIEFLADVNSRTDIKSLINVSGRAKQHSTYDLMMVEKFRLFLKNRPEFNPENFDKEELKNYVLIIDEINRANLPSVLGELIYALEYRSESVNSMYDLDGDTSIILPPNLYIIGTMNTADRSVGHIDYAIRRRFAFVEILPTNEVIKNVVTDPAKSKALTLFEKVSNLFLEKNIAPDFKAKDVQLGHSYFLVTKEDEKEEDEKLLSRLQLKLDYEIKPLLKEYLTDGILFANVSINGVNWETEKYIDQLSF